MNTDEDRVRFTTGRHQNIKGLRWEATPSDVKVFDRNGKLLRIEPPTYWYDKKIIWLHLDSKKTLEQE